MTLLPVSPCRANRNACRIPAPSPRLPRQGLQAGGDRPGDRAVPCHPPAHAVARTTHNQHTTHSHIRRTPNEAASTSSYIWATCIREWLSAVDPTRASQAKRLRRVPNHAASHGSVAWISAHIHNDSVGPMRGQLPYGGGMRPPPAPVPIASGGAAPAPYPLPASPSSMPRCRRGHALPWATWPRPQCCWSLWHRARLARRVASRGTAHLAARAWLGWYRSHRAPAHTAIRAADRPSLAIRTACRVDTIGRDGRRR